MREIYKTVQGIGMVLVQGESVFPSPIILELEAQSSNYLINMSDENTHSLAFTLGVHYCFSHLWLMLHCDRATAPRKCCISDENNLPPIKHARNMGSDTGRAFISLFCRRTFRELTLAARDSGRTIAQGRG